MELFAVGIEIGYAYSGYAFVQRLGHVNAFPDAHTTNWSGGKLFSPKAPTSILLNSSKDLVAFGYEAEDNFAELLCKEKHNSYYYFQEIKMQLQSQRFSKTTQLIDYSRKYVDAITVFGHLIRFFKDNVIKSIKLRSKDKIDNDDILFVLTVPSLMEDPAKEFMRLAAEKAGIKKTKLAITTETVAAATFCHTLRTSRSNFNDNFKSGMYMVIDIAGESSVFTVHQQLMDSSIQDIIPLSSSPNGGKSIDIAFFNFIHELCGGQEIVNKLISEDYTSYIDLCREFEAKKRSFQSANRGNVVIKIPATLIELIGSKFGKIEYAVQNVSHKYDVRYAKQKLHVSAIVFGSFFKPTIAALINHTKKLLANESLSRLDTVFLIGGFSECELVQNAMQKVIYSPKRLIIPEDAGLAVIKGAAFLGFESKIPTQLPVKFTNKKQSSSGLYMSAAQTSTTKCISCDNTAIFFCYECKSALCQQCRKPHDKLPTTRNHTVTDLKQVDLTSFKTVSECLLHKSECIYYCTKCNELICGICVTTKHKGHDISDIKSKVEILRKKAKKQVSEMKEKCGLLSVLIDKKKTMQAPKLHIDAASAIADINAAVEKVKKTVEWKKGIKINEVENQEELAKEDLEYELSNKERTHRQQLSVCKSLEILLNETHDVSFYNAYTTLSREMFELDDVIRDSRQHNILAFDSELFVQEVVFAITADFQMSLVPQDDGSVVIKKNSDIRKMEKDSRGGNVRVKPTTHHPN